MSSARGLKIGKIEVICHETSFSHKEIRSRSSKVVNFSSANKKDVLDVTKRKHAMATTRVGKLIRDKKPYDPPSDKPRETSIWSVGDEVKKIHVEYHMTQTLLDWGIQPVRPMWPEHDKGKVDVDE